ncbi:hypothetical protein EV426DRAFT_625532 [Tirmania nivea]|nr:hypothetical protein EV426DRAFT_625532 [Tirmania nivea]
MNIEPEKIPPTDLKELHNYLCKASRKFGTITIAKRLHFICLILIFVSDLCGAEIKSLVEESMLGKNIHIDGQFEYIIEKFCIVEAKKNDMEQGMLQNPWM